MTAGAEALLDGLNENAVDFRDNYDGTLTEPVVLPAAFPNLLANGSSGIAVGMATNIPPHNIDELCDACLHLIKTPDARDDTLLNFVPGPDFPTGGVIVEPRESIAQTYRTGRGAFRLRVQLGDRGSGARPVADRGHRNPLSGAEIQADRTPRRTDPDQESCRSSPMSATNAPTISAWCWNRGPRTSIRMC